MAEQRYAPYGEVRWSSGTLPTDLTYTGQRNDGYHKLLDFRARWYDPKLGRFISPDTIIPGLGNPQNLNRFAYVIGNPLRYRDPTGHKYDPGGPTGTPGLSDKDVSLPQRGDVLLENNRSIMIPGKWDHAIVIVSVDPENPDVMWVVEAERDYGVWHHQIDLQASDLYDWTIVRVNTSAGNREAAARWAEHLAGWDETMERQETAGAPFVSMIPFRGSPWGWLDMGPGTEGYYCFEVAVDAYLGQGVDITDRAQRLSSTVDLSTRVSEGEYMVTGQMLYNQLFYLGTEIYNSPNTVVVKSKK